MSPKLDAARLLAELDALIGPLTATPPEPQVSVDIPAAGIDALLPQSAPTPDAQPSPANGVRVLVAEDNPDYRRIVRFLLSEAGYDVLEAADGLQALELARRQVPDLALLDFEMPGLNGYELIQEMRARDETRKIPILMLTGAPNRRHLKELPLDIAEFLEKPISNAELLNAVARALGPGKLPPAPALNGASHEPAVADAAPVEALESFEDSQAESELQIEEHKKDADEESAAGLDVLANDSPLVNRINRIIVRAVDMGASDIHIEPQERHISVRVRVDGGLRSLGKLPLALAPQVAARVKIMANMVITERRRPQDGQIRAEVKGKKIEFRVSTIPSIHGEKIVMRVLGTAKLKGDVADLGLNARDLEAAERALQSPHGLILATGPTGSGKTTTLYTMLKRLNQPDMNVMTVEDPVEYELAGITQVHVKPLIGVTFESVLRSFLRQDPDIMLVGEIRDLETADIAVKAAITGHLVLSTLHTNSSPAAVTRLTHMGVAPFLLADSLRLIIAQRLVRRLCPDCRAPSEVSDEIKRLLGEKDAALITTCFAGKGCAKCGRSGYKGRMPLFEVLEVRSPELRQLILATQNADAIAKQAVAEGMTPLRQAALEAVAAGTTSIEEAMSIILSE